MKFKYFTNKNSRHRRVGSVSMTVSKKGYIGISHRAVEKLNLKEGQEVYFVQDEHNPRDWYLGINIGGKYSVEDCFVLRRTKATKGFALHNSITANAILDSLEEDIPDNVNCVSFPLATMRSVIEGQTLYSIIVKGLKLYNAKD